MGIIQEYNCPTCRKTWKIFTGHGMNHSTLNRVLESFSMKIKAEILKENNISAGFEPLFDFNYRPAICHQCQNIVALPVLRFIESGRTYTGECPECGNPAEILETTSAICPKCLKQYLSCQETGHWD